MAGTNISLKQVFLGLAVLAVVLIPLYYAVSGEEEDHSITECIEARVISKDYDLREIEVVVDSVEKRIPIRGRYTEEGTGTGYYSLEMLELIPENEVIIVCYSTTAAEVLKFNNKTYTREVVGHEKE